MISLQTITAWTAEPSTLRVAHTAGVNDKEHANGVLSVLGMPAMRAAR
jgi:hypothetical protein